MYVVFSVYIYLSPSEVPGSPCGKGRSPYAAWPPCGVRDAPTLKVFTTEFEIGTVSTIQIRSYTISLIHSRGNYALTPNTLN